jgi:hypothetical protein
MLPLSMKKFATTKVLRSAACACARTRAPTNSDAIFADEREREERASYCDGETRSGALHFYATAEIEEIARTVAKITHTHTLSLFSLPHNSHKHVL